MEQRYQQPPEQHPPEQQSLLSGGKEEEARLERERAAVFQQMQYQQQMVPLYTTPSQGLVATLQPSLPSHLWPHSFIFLSVVLMAALSIFNILTLITTIPAVILSSVSYYQSTRGKYSAAKSSSKIALMLSLVAVAIFGVPWFIGWITGMYYLPYFIYYND